MRYPGILDKGSGLMGFRLVYSSSDRNLFLADILQNRRLKLLNFNSLICNTENLVLFKEKTTVFYFKSIKSRFF